MAVSTVDAEAAELCAILYALHVDGRDWILNRPQAARKSFQAVESKVIDTGHISSLFRYFEKSKADSFPDDKYLVIRPTKHDKKSTLAIWCRWDYSKKPLRFGCYLGVWSEFKVDEGATLSFLGSRYETPEENGIEHKFHHLQPCRSMGTKDIELKGAMPVNTRTPTTPLPANSPSELMISMIISLYDNTEVSKLQSIINNHDRFRKTNVNTKLSMWLGGQPTITFQPA